MTQHYSNQNNSFKHIYNNINSCNAHEGFLTKKTKNHLTKNKNNIEVKNSS